MTIITSSTQTIRYEQNGLDMIQINFAVEADYVRVTLTQDDLTATEVRVNGQRVQPSTRWDLIEAATEVITRVAALEKRQERIRNTMP